MAQERADERSVQEARGKLEPFFREVASVVIGQEHLIRRLVIALLTDGHVLVEGVPGLAKTLAIRTVSGALELSFSRVQFTPDLLPADVIGTQIYNPKETAFYVKKGPIFANVVLADEINRAPAKVQSALLQAMEERQVTIGEETFPLPRPFFVLATQNPIEQEGTYVLPEAQLDRFLFKVVVKHLSRQEELKLIDRHGSVNASRQVQAVLKPEDLAQFRQVVDSIHIDDRVKGYIVDMVRCTRNPSEYGQNFGSWIQNGSSPRGILALVRASQGEAFLNGRYFVTPSDVQAVAGDVLAHRILISYEAEAENIDSLMIVEKIVQAIPTP
jgi:MoxR-like ATPase